MLIDRHQSLLLIVDIQEKLAPAIHEGAAAIANNQRLLRPPPIVSAYPSSSPSNMYAASARRCRTCSRCRPGRNASRRCISPARANPDFST